MKDKQTRQQEQTVIKRNFPVNDFTASGEGHIEGHAAVFLRCANISGKFNEVIEPGAFDECDFDDVPFLINHDQRRIPVARSRRNNGGSTMRLSVDGKGLLVSADLDIENNSEARSLYSAVKRGDVDGMSFDFKVKKERWENMGEKTPTRFIERIAKVYDVSAVNDPAYVDTDIHARGSLDNDRMALENAIAAYELENSELLKKERLKIQILSEV